MSLLKIVSCRDTLTYGEMRSLVVGFIGWQSVVNNVTITVVNTSADGLARQVHVVCGNTTLLASHTHRHRARAWRVTYVTVIENGEYRNSAYGTAPGIEMARHGRACHARHGIDVLLSLCCML